MKKKVATGFLCNEFLIHTNHYLLVPPATRIRTPQAEWEPGAPTSSFLVCFTP